jgi:hypothetical protein
MKRTLVFALSASFVLAATAGAEVRMIQSSRADKVNATTSIMRRQTAGNATEKWVGKKSIVKDAATGQYRRPTQAEATAMVRSLKQLTARPEAINASLLPGGTRQGTINGAFSNVVIGRPKADGTIETLCVQTFEEAAAFLGLESEPAESEQ